MRVHARGNDVDAQTVTRLAVGDGRAVVCTERRDADELGHARHIAPTAWDSRDLVTTLRGDGCEMPIEDGSGNLWGERGGLVIEEGGRRIARDEALRLQDRDERLSIGDQSMDAAGPQAPGEHCSRGGAIRGVGNDLGEHRVVERRNNRAGLNP